MTAYRIAKKVNGVLHYVRYEGFVTDPDQAEYFTSFMEALYHLGLIRKDEPECFIVDPNQKIL